MNAPLFPFPATLAGYQTLFAGCSVSEAVRLETGNLVRQLYLISVATIGPSLSFQLTYNSRGATVNQGFGHGWTHNWLAKIIPSSTAPVFTDDSGRDFTFKLDGSDWVLDLSESRFDSLRLTSLPGDEWRISYFPDGEVLDFDSDGRLVRRQDTLGNALTASYDGSDRLIEIQEDAMGVTSGRIIQLSYGTDTITLTDPLGHDYTLVLSSTNDNLVQVIGPEGCVTTFDYADPTNHLITGRTDPVVRDPEESPLVDQAWSYTFGEDGQLLSVTDSRGMEVTYEYVDDYEEYTAGPGVGEPQDKLGFPLTIVTVPAPNPGDDPSVWKYVFDQEGNLRRVIDPNFHQRRFIWGPQGQLLYEASGYLNWDPSLIHDATGTAPGGSRPGPYDLGIRDQANMRFRTNVYNNRGDLLQASDGNGMITHYEYSEDRLVAVTPGRANTAVQGEWEKHYGSQGFYLCGATGSADVAALPTYVSAITPGSGSVAPRVLDYTTVETNQHYLVDPRNLRYREGDGLVKAKGCWKSSLDGSGHPYRRFQFTLEMASETNFNLSLYTNAADLGLWFAHDINYEEQSGYELEFLITDSVRTQAYRMPCNQGGIWATFPVQPGSGDVLVEVRARGNNNSTDNLATIGDAVLSAIAFDAYDNRTTRVTYNEAGQVTSVIDPLGNTSVFEYNEDGTLASSQEPGAGAATLFEYEDDYKNLTKITDPLEGEVHLTYDLNGNLLTVLDADSRLTQLFYDAKNRLIRVKDALNFETLWTYDAGGRVIEVEDAKGRTTQVAYKHQRVWKVTDAKGQTMTMEYTDAGFPLSVTDRRGKTTTVTYDAANQVTLVAFPDGAKARYALDSLGRIAALTSPNGNQDDPEDMNLEGAKNILYNPLAEETRPYDLATYAASPGALAPRYWNGGNRALDAEGRAYLPLQTGGVTEWKQYETPMSAGGRYVASFLAKKTDGTSGTTTARMEFIHRLHKDYPGEYHYRFSDPIVGTSFAPTSSDWEESPRDLVEIPGDIQASTLKPALSQTSIQRDSGSAPLGVKNMSLQRLSVCLEYDGENLREICLPDGARQRVEYDRFGRPFLSTDPNGRRLLREYDNLDRVVHVQDSLGNELFFEYNERSDLTLFRLRSQGVDQDTVFDWDDLHRLEQITYPDETTEVFTYTAAGDLQSYTDNLEQTRTFDYDALHRLKTITYADTTTVSLFYDKVGNLTQVIERNGDEWSYGYDELNRLCLQVFTSDGNQTGFTYRYNENGQRMAMGTPPVYGTTEYGEATSDIWTIPEVGGRDEVGRLLQVEDADSNVTSMSYDVDGRCTQLSHPNSVHDLFAYDIVGKLLNVTVEKDSETLLKLDYSYNLGQDRIGLNTDQDTFVYLTDDAGRLVEECHNRFCIHQERIWKQGHWDKVSFDREDQVLRLIELNDDFAGNRFHNQRWTLTTRRQSGYDQAPTLELNNVGLEVRQDQGLHIAYPRGFVNNTGAHQAAVHDYIGQDLRLGGHHGLNSAGGLDLATRDSFFLDLRHAEKLQGDFDVALDYEGLQASGDGFHLSLGICPTYLAAGSPPVAGGNYFYSADVNGVAQVSGKSWNGGSFQWSGLYSEGAAGQLRLKRTGSSLEAFHRDTDGDSWTSIGTESGPSSEVNLYLAARYDNDAVEVTVKNFRHLDSKTHAALGHYESPIYDAGHTVSWDRLQWVEDLPSGCDVELEVRVADDWAEFENFVSPPVWFGPTGPGSKFTTASGQNMPRPVTGRYAQIRATLTGTTTATPSLSDIQFECNRASAVESRVIRYRHDEAGNILEVTTDTRYGRRSDKRDDPGWDPEERLNTLNQIMRQDIDGDSWDFTWDANGNLTSKTNGSESFTYSWDDCNRLVQVSWDGAVGGYHAARFHSGKYHAATGTATQWTVDYTYDSAGRMLTRDDGTNLTKFYWDGWDMVREVTGESVTEYLIPQGTLLSFKRDGDTFYVSCDALGSVRLVTDEEGAVVSRLSYGAYGELLAGSFDGVPGGMPYTWVGALGVRVDSLTGLYYMRQRWYDPTLQRFISRDQLMNKNRYSYAENSPANLVDVSGREADTPTGGHYEGGGIYSNAPHSYHNYGEGPLDPHVDIPKMPRIPVPKIPVPQLDIEPLKSPKDELDWPPKKRKRIEWDGSKTNCPKPSHPPKKLKLWPPHAWNFQADAGSTLFFFSISFTYAPDLGLYIGPGINFPSHGLSGGPSWRLGDTNVDNLHNTIHGLSVGAGGQAPTPWYVPTGAGGSLNDSGVIVGPRVGIPGGGGGYHWSYGPFMVPGSCPQAEH